ncbi:uncharacterized protein RJT21DRAFT_18601 [Scheffersomyces amazonensis]|uniref:uncharacterized protein n=1 Tax=Scheffersomyces amazonensis TaxID=1078765 RepID=UPI00315D718E
MPGLRRRPTIPDEGDDTTFVNNSDYMESESETKNVVEPPKQPSASASPSPSPSPPKEVDDNPFLSDNENEVQDLNIKSRVTKPTTEGTSRQSSDKDMYESKVFDEPQVRSGSYESEANTSTSSNTVGEKKSISSSLSLNSSTVPILSYSQQQAQVLSNSPSKRRDILLQIKPSSNEPRLVIGKLELINFKSYAGTQVIGPFNSSFSAVVGPNGSGKSNVIDSMLFVFGFRASKMRQGKLSELIHNSSGGEKLDYCQVNIYFHNVLDDTDEPNKASIIPNSEIIVSRKAFRNNQSNYYINGKSSNYTEVTSMLKEKGIDLDHKRFLILQGEVESIAQMKPKAEKENDDGLLEYLEDIIGTSKYKKLIEENMTKIDELNDVCVEKENRFVLVEKDKESLEDRKNEALKFLEAEKAWTCKKSIQFQVNIVEYTKHLEDSKHHYDEIKHELDEERQANSELTKGIETFTKQQESTKSQISVLDKELVKLTKVQKDTNKQNVTLEEKLKNLTSKIKKIEKTKESSNHILSSSNSKLQQNNQANEQFKQEIQQLNSNMEIEKAKLDEIKANLSQKTSGFSKEIDSLNTTLQPWNEKLNHKENAIQLLQSNIEILYNQRNSITNQLEEARNRLISIKQEGKQKEEEVQEAEDKVEQIIEQINLGEEQCSIEKRQLDSKGSSLSTLRQKTQDSINSLTNYQNKNKVLTSLLRLAKSGRINGFHGRLGDLGVIDRQYDIAISTVCPGLDSMVVDSVETAQACIDYLRKNKLGYANFICLDKLRQFNLNPIQTPGNPATIKRLFDLINPTNPKFAPAFYSKLYNTLVAPDLAEAKRVAYGAKRWKVVTLDGKVVDTSGTMSGGGNHFARGAMRLNGDESNSLMDISPEDIDKLKHDLHELEQEVEQLESSYRHKESMLIKLRDLKPETEFTVSRLKLDIQSLASEKKEVSITCKNLIAEKDKMESEGKYDKDIRAKEKEVEELKNSKQEIKSQMSETETKIKQLEEKIMEAGGVELRVQTSRVDSIKQKLEIINEKTAGDRLEIRKLENEIKRQTKVLAQAEEDWQTCQVEVNKFESQKSELSSKLEEIQVEISKVQQSKDELDGVLEGLQSELEEYQEKCNQFRSVEVELENKLEKYSSIIKKSQSKIKENEENLQALVPRDASAYIYWLSEEEQVKYNSGILEEIPSDESQIDGEQVDREIEQLEDYLNNAKVDLEVLKEYGEKKHEFESRRQDLNVAVTERDEIKSLCEDLKRRRLDEFMEGFNMISMTLKDMYRMITMGGNAELELVDSLDPFSEGILFSVMPPKKSWKNISNLSGGEKTLSSLALVFALHQYKPTPLYVMDEIDAALDFRNVSIVANYIKERTKNAQFIVISLRNNMFELAQQLVGIYKVDNKTKSISLQNKDFLVAA